MSSKVYAVKNGRKTGIFNSWADCEAQVKGFAGAKYKSFPSLQEAMAWLGNGIRQESLFPEDLPKRAPYSAAKKTAAPKSPIHTVTTEKAIQNADFIIYTDGSCLRNPDGPGGWAAVIRNTSTGEVTELHEGFPSTTNNRMELSAAIGALSHFDTPKSIVLYTDSQYLKNAFTKRWLYNWKRNGWRTATGGEVKNKDLWISLDTLYQKHKVTFQWVKGHVGVELNERCDELAKSEAMKFMG